VLLDAREDIDDWKPVFQDFSNRLYTATNRQVQLGTVTIYQTHTGKEPADIVLSPSVIDSEGKETAYTLAYPKTCSGSRSGIGTDGALGRIYMSTDFRTQDPRGADYILLHESGHWLFGIRDYYLGALQDPNNSRRFLLPDATWKTLTDNDFSGDYLRCEKYYNIRLRQNPIFYCNASINSTARNSSRTDIMDGRVLSDAFFSTPVGTGFLTDTIRRYQDTFYFDNQEFDVIVWTQQNVLNQEESSWETIVRNWPHMTIPNVDLTTLPEQTADDVEFVEGSQSCGTNDS